MGPNKKKPTASLASLGEWGFLDKILPRLKAADRKRFLIPPGDDAAVLARPFKIVLSTDGLTQNTHFKFSWDSTLKKKAGFSLARGLGWKLIGSSLSDLAAMGDVGDRWAMVFLAAPATLSEEFLMELYQGVRQAAARYHCALAGGDTVRSDGLTLNSSVGGILKGSRVLVREGASPGDFLCVAGSVGDADRGLQILSHRLKNLPAPTEKYFIRRFFEARPLFSEGKILAAEKQVSAALDLSDSLYESINILLRPKNLGCDVNLNAVPVSPRYRQFFGALPSLLSGGEDYALLFTARKQALARLSKKMKFAVIGQVMSPHSGRYYFLNGRGVTPPSHFRHFS